jgi:hypothetical protein
MLPHDLFAPADAAHEPVGAPAAFDAADEGSLPEYVAGLHRVTILSHCVKKRVPARAMAALSSASPEMMRPSV